jgi:ubiquinone/menaquinone biosynthesis C-methylase UbiE
VKAHAGTLPRDILETAAGTGIATRAIAAALPQAAIVATDLNQAMLDIAAGKASVGSIRWQQADAQALPFAPGSFDAVVCCFGVMFMPERTTAYREVLRVLRPSGRFLFTVWDRLEVNPLGQEVDAAVAGLFPSNPPHFLARTPYGYHDRARIQSDLREAGFTSVTIEEVWRESDVPSAWEPAMGLCQGSPLRGEIEARDPGGLVRATEAAAAALRARFGSGPFRAPVQALFITAS